MLFTDLFAALLLAHLLADFPLQTNALIRLKNRGGFGILAHVAVHLATSMFLLRFQTEVKAGYWLILTIIGISHFLIDWVKCTLGATGSTLRMFLVDQYLHIISLLAAIGICKLLTWPTPASIVPASWLLPSLTLAFGLALMVMGWVWVNSLDHKIVHQSRYLAWSQQRLLLLEQRLGFLLLVGLGTLILFSAEF